MIKLHYHPMSTYSRRVLMAFLEKDVPHELVLVDMAARKHRDPAYLALNPYGRVPTLQDGDFVLYESTAILDYIETLYPQPPLVPADPRERALVDMHIKLCDIQLARHAGTIMFPKRFLPKERWDEKAMALAKGEIDKHLAILEGQIRDKEYLVGDRYTLAEVCYTPFVQFFPLMEIAPPPAVASWVARMLARPSAVKTAPTG